KGIDLARERPKLLTDAAVRQAEVVITMGCGDACPFYPGKRYEDCELEDPAGKDLDTVRRIRDEIERRVIALAGAIRRTSRGGDGRSSRGRRGTVPWLADRGRWRYAPASS